jgi:hypothetical protein
VAFDAIKGRVTGKQTGKSLMVRSLAGIGETALLRALISRMDDWPNNRLYPRLN